MADYLGGFCSLKLRTASCRKQIPISELQAQQDAYYNLSLKDLYWWRLALQVPLIDVYICSRP